MFLASFLSADPASLLLDSILVLAAYGVLLAVYRLFFSPISQFPGPRLAAATGWHEFYYDVIQGGVYPFQIVEMHKQYGAYLPGVPARNLEANTNTGELGKGPIIRINPWELHVSDPDFYSTLYVSGSVRRTGMFPRQRYGLGAMGTVSSLVVLAYPLGGRVRSIQV
jgi:hypothetical protein